MMRACHKHGVPYTIENPRSSYFWGYPAIREVMEEFTTFEVDFQACMFGSRRDKWTRLVTNREEFLELSVPCDGSHEHDPWG